MAAQAPGLPTDGLGALSAAADGSKLAASALRWLAACAAAFAGLLLLSLALAAVERAGAEEPAEVSASAYLDFDLSVLRALAARGLRSSTPEPAHRALLAMWARRPDWQLPQARTEPARLVPLREAWAAVASEKSRFRTAARGAGDALPFLLGGLALAFLAAALAGVLAQAARAPAGLDPLPAEARGLFLRRLAFCAGVYVLVAHPLWPMLDAGLFYDRTRSLGLGLSAVLFVAAFAGTSSGAAARALFAHADHARHLEALSGRPALFTAARLAVLDAADWLVPLVPALAAAALFVCAKADQDPALHAPASGLGALIRAAMREASVGERLSSSALVAGGLVLLWFLGHRFVVEMRSALGARP
jgi:hypothetical protein